MATALNDTAWDVRKLAGSLGAEVRGIALEDAGPGDAKAILELLAEHMVLFFPEQKLDPDSHIAFGKLFGELEAHPNLALGAERPEFFELRAEGGAGAIADEWHSDLTCQPEPSVFAILHMVKCPPYGGDTMWANMYKAYEALTPPMQAFCEGLTALHDAHAHGKPENMAVHPVVRVHPETGRKSLFVNEHFTRRIVELDLEASDVLLSYLLKHATQNRFALRYHWTEGTVAMWDNRCTQHYVLDDFEGHRMLQRVTVMGDHPERAEPVRYPAYDDTLRGSSWRDMPYMEFLRAQKS